MKPLISICIPCFKREKLVLETLKSIYVDNSDVDLSEYEIIISDNSVGREIEQIAKQFMHKGNIKYYYTKCEGFLNSYYVLTYAQGDVLKLHNSQVLFKKGALSQIIEDAKKAITCQSLLFYSNGMLLHNNNKEFKSFEDFLNYASYWISWSNGFCILKQNFDIIKNIELNRLFPHTSLLMTQNQLERYIVNDHPLFRNQRVPKRGDHNKFKAFTIDFPSLIVAGYENGLMSESCKKHILHDVLYDYLPVLVFNKYIARIETFDSTDFKQNIKKYFPKHSFVLVCLLSIFVPFKLIVRRISAKIYN